MARIFFQNTLPFGLPEMEEKKAKKVTVMRIRLP
jgi:hypothetical protein